MSHTHTVKAVAFVGYDSLLSVAIEKATEALNLWYAHEEILWYGDGGSVFQMSASTVYRSHDDGSEEYEYIISVFDTRGNNNR